MPVDKNENNLGKDESISTLENKFESQVLDKTVEQIIVAMKD